jgi:hypothetical protein
LLSENSKGYDVTISDEMKLKLFHADIIGDDECSTGTARERNGQLQIVWDDGAIQTVTRIIAARVMVDDEQQSEDPREHIAVETSNGETFLFVVPRAH